MIEVEVQTEIARPAADVYDFVVTHYVDNHPRGDPKTVRTELTGGGGGLAVGATGIEVRRDMGRRETAYNFRVTELTADCLAFEAKGGSTTFGATWQVTPDGEASSRLGMRFRFGMGGIMRLFEPLMKGGVRKDMAGSAERIRSSWRSRRHARSDLRFLPGRSRGGCKAGCPDPLDRQDRSPHRR